MLTRTLYPACPLCEATQSNVLHRVDCTAYPLYQPALSPVMTWLKCVACDHVYVDGIYTDEALQLIFSRTHPSQAVGYDLETQRYVAARMIEKVLPYAHSGRWLDIGFGNGALLLTAQEFGFTSVGIDLRRDVVESILRFGIEAHEVDLMAFTPAMPFDVISLCDVLEHMPYPPKSLHAVHGLLADDGRFFFLCPIPTAPSGACLMPQMPIHIGRRWSTITTSADSDSIVFLMNVGSSLCATASANDTGCAWKSLPARKNEVNMNHTATHGSPPYRLNVGCGRNIQNGYLNLDAMPLPGVDIVCNLETLREHPIDLPDASVEYFLLSHVIEHIRDSLGLMEELWRLAAPGAIAQIRVPHGASDDAWEDPTHVRSFFPGSFGYFSQPYYWRADYGYRGDWKVERMQLHMDRVRCAGLTPNESLAISKRERNVVREIVCELSAVKPIRAPLRELQSFPLIEIHHVD